MGGGNPKIFILMTLMLIMELTSASAGIMLTAPVDYQVVQRKIGKPEGVVTIAGNISGIKTGEIQAEVTRYATGESVVSWQTVKVTTDKDGKFTGTLVVPQGGWYRLAVRMPGSNTDDASSGRWGVGINVLCIGQSNMVGNGDIHSYTPVTAENAALYGNDRRWRICADPYDTGGAPADIDFDPWFGASMIPAFVNALCAAVPGVPVGIIPAAKGATTLHGTAKKTSWSYRDKTRHDNPDNLYGNSVAKVRSAGGAEIIIMHQGETDATNGVTRDQYAADLKRLLSYYREDIHPGITLYICQLARSFTPVNQKNRTDATLQPIRAAQLEADDPPGIYLAAVCIDVPVRPRDDHYERDGYDMIGARVANAVAFHLGMATYYRGPSIIAATVADTSGRTVDVTISHRGGTDISPIENITGFQVHGNGKAIPVAAAVRRDASTVRLTLERRLTGEGTLQYLAGKAPDIAGAVKDNSALRLPLEPTAVPVSILPAVGRNPN